jgi:hypothetical protein
MLGGDQRLGDPLEIVETQHRSFDRLRVIVLRLYHQPVLHRRSLAEAMQCDRVSVQHAYMLNSWRLIFLGEGHRLAEVQVGV